MICNRLQRIATTIKNLRGYPMLPNRFTEEIEWSTFTAICLQEDGLPEFMLAHHPPAVPGHT